MRLTAWVVLIAALLLWSGNWIVARAVRDDVAPGIATVGRQLIVLAILVPLCFRNLRDRLPSLTAWDWKILAGVGFTGGGVHLGMQWLGLHYTTATNGILYLSTSPILILLMGLPLGERAGWHQVAGILISFCGVFLIATHGEVGTLSFNIGDLLAFGSMVMWSAYTILLRLRRDALGTLEHLTMFCAFGLVFMLPWLAFDLYSEPQIKLTRDGVLAIAYAAIGALLLAYAGWTFAVKRLGAVRAGATLHLMPAFGVILSAVFLAEYPSWYHFAGIALILGGVALSSLK